MLSGHFCMCSLQFLTCQTVIADHINSYIIRDNSEVGKYLRSRVHSLQVFTRDELGVSSIHLHDFVKLLPL